MSHIQYSPIAQGRKELAAMRKLAVQPVQARGLILAHVAFAIACGVVVGVVMCGA